MRGGGAGPVPVRQRTSDKVAPLFDSALPKRPKGAPLLINADPAPSRRCPTYTCSHDARAQAPALACTHTGCRPLLRRAANPSSRHVTRPATTGTYGWWAPDPRVANAARPACREASSAHGAPSVAPPCDWPMFFLRKFVRGRWPRRWLMLGSRTWSTLVCGTTGAWYCGCMPRTS